MINWNFSGKNSCNNVIRSDMASAEFDPRRLEGRAPSHAQINLCTTPRQNKCICCLKETSVPWGCLQWRMEELPCGALPGIACEDSSVHSGVPKQEMRLCHKILIQLCTCHTQNKHYGLLLLWQGILQGCCVPCVVTSLCIFFFYL